MNPYFQNPMFQSVQFQNPHSQNPQFQSPQIQSPQIQSPQFQSPQIQSPQFQSPQLQNPQFQSPQIQSPQFSPQFQNAQFCQYPNIQTQGATPGLGLGVGMGFTLSFPSLEKISKPLNERVKYVINTVNYLLNKHDIGKLLEEKTLLKILHNSFFLNLFFFIKFI
jgi:hypothetical protein